LNETLIIKHLSFQDKENVLLEEFSIIKFVTKYISARYSWLSMSV